MLDIIATVLSIVGIFLNAKKIIYCWHIWIVSNICWIIYCAQTNQLPALIMWIVFFFSNMYGYIQWKKNKGLLWDMYHIHSLAHGQHVLFSGN